MLLAFAAPAIAASKTTTKKSSSKTTKVSGKSTKRAKSSRRVRRGAWKRRGQQGIKEGRAREIQAALIRERYLEGEPTGQWDSRTQAAMQKFQADNGWQTRVLPDSRALIKLGLGPDHSGLLNPETAVVPAASAPAPGGGVR
jgi:peptidoglycan hydrolase-like protein with peptidoglycan-binding domain